MRRGIRLIVNRVIYPLKLVFFREPFNAAISHATNFTPLNDKTLSQWSEEKHSNFYEGIWWRFRSRATSMSDTDQVQIEVHNATLRKSQSAHRLPAMHLIIQFVELQFRQKTLIPQDP